MPNLRHLDLTRCRYSPSLLGRLHELCPLLESLRLGGLSRESWRERRTQREKAAAAALIQSLPSLSHHPVQLADCWEDEEQLQVENYLTSEGSTSQTSMPLVEYMRSADLVLTKAAP